MTDSRGQADPIGRNVFRFFLDFRSRGRGRGRGSGDRPGGGRNSCRGKSLHDGSLKAFGELVEILPQPVDLGLEFLVLLPQSGDAFQDDFELLEIFLDRVEFGPQLLLLCINSLNLSIDLRAGGAIASGNKNECQGKRAKQGCTRAWQFMDHITTIRARHVTCNGQKAFLILRILRSAIGWRSISCIAADRNLRSDAKLRRTV
jgi:hypothetical protein